MRRKIKKFELEKIASIMASMGFADILHELKLAHFLPFFKFIKHRKKTGLLPSGNHLARLLCELGPGFSEIGRISASRGDIIPTEFQNGLLNAPFCLSKLSVENPMHVISREFGRKALKEFSSIDPDPFAAHLLGFSYKGVLRDGRRVLIVINSKKQSEALKKDCEIIDWLFDHIFRNLSKPEFSTWNAIYDEFKSRAFFALNLDMVAFRSEAFAGHFFDDKRIIIPDICWEYVSKSVMIQTRNNFPSFADIAIGKFSKDFSKRILSNRLTSAMARQYLSGFFFLRPNLSDFQAGMGNSVVFNNFLCLGFSDPKHNFAFVNLLVSLLEDNPKQASKIFLSEHYKLCVLENCHRFGIVLDSVKGESVSEKLYFAISRAYEGKIIVPFGISQAAESVLYLETALARLDPKFDFKAALLKAVKKIQKR